MKFDVMMKPTGLAKRTQRMCPEYLVSVEAESRDAAAWLARASAVQDGFQNYAVSKINEVRHVQ